MKKQNQIFIVLFFILVFTTTYGQNDQPSFDDDVKDIPAAPIDDYLPHALFIAVALGWYLVRKEVKQG